MAEFHQNSKERRDVGSGKCLTSHSPCTVTSHCTASQAFGLVQLHQPRNFQIQDQISWNELHSAQKNLEKKPWTFEQQGNLLKLHDELGNKWTDIAVQFPGRDHNCVKNHFYAQVRKSLRRINYFVKRYFNSNLKQLNINHISKMITLLSEKKLNQPIYQQKEEEIQNLKRFLFEISKIPQSEQLNQEKKHYIRSNTAKISNLLQQVKKNSLIGRKLKIKKDNKNIENQQVNIERTTTIKVQENQRESYASNMGVATPLLSSSLMMENMQQGHQNYFVYFVPWGNLERNAIPCINPIYAYPVAQPVQQYTFIGGNIFINS